VDSTKAKEQQGDLCPAVEVPTQAKGVLEWATRLIIALGRAGANQRNPLLDAEFRGSAYADSCYIEGK
jgi:hypothetical protein